MGRGIVTEESVAAQNAAQAKLEADAKRYRFLRQFGDPNFDDSKLPVLEEPVSSEHLDAMVDAAMIGMGFEA